MKGYYIVVLVLYWIYSCFATYGVDVSSPISVSAFQCLKNNGYDFAIVRCWQSNGVPDPNCPSTVANAWAAGMAHVDVYMFPCFGCGNPSGQVADALQFIRSNGVRFGQFWFDIEGPQYWSGNQGANQNFMQAMINQANSEGVHIGIYTSYSQWSPIMGGWTGGSPYSLWYAHYDGNPNFNDWFAFNGWSTPAMKQYNGDVTVCGVGIDQDWYPD